MKDRCDRCGEESVGLHHVGDEGLCDHCVPNAVENPGKGFWNAYFKIYNEEERKWQDARDAVENLDVV